MDIRIIDNSFDKILFNEVSAHPLQSWLWGEAREKMGIEVLRIGEYANNQIKNVYQITFHKIQFTNFKIGYLPRSSFPSKDVLEFLYDYGKKNNVIFIKIEPYVIKHFPVISSEARNLANEVSVKKENYASLDSSVASLLRNDKRLVKSPHPLFPQWTQIIDLTKSEDELLKRMHPKTRYNIRLAQRKGVIVKEMSNNEGFKIFSDLYFATCKRQKYFGHNYQYHQTIWDNLKNKISHILIAYYEDIPLAAYQLFYFKDTVYYVYGGTSKLHKNLMASNLLMWQTIRLGKNLGSKKLDMWGSLPPGYNQNDPWAGFTKFKEGYGGKFLEFAGSFDLIVNLNLYKFYHYLLKIRNIYLKLSRLL